MCMPDWPVCLPNRWLRRKLLYLSLRRLVRPSLLLLLLPSNLLHHIRVVSHSVHRRNGIPESFLAHEGYRNLLSGNLPSPDCNSRCRSVCSINNHHNRALATQCQRHFLRQRPLHLRNNPHHFLHFVPAQNNC
ncbi:hypothetical protein BJ741DRAFT_605273 [Chytriomyces cf. hyalinus JEL632]|nr:hypothetical protein BJ741DRAFT_605273 [Chytriomyces cf. hyalinus JEL632]